MPGSLPRIEILPKASARKEESQIVGSVQQKGNEIKRKVPQVPIIRYGWWEEGAALEEGFTEFLLASLSKKTSKKQLPSEKKIK